MEHRSRTGSGEVALPAARPVRPRPTDVVEHAGLVADHITDHSREGEMKKHMRLGVGAASAFALALGTAGAALAAPWTTPRAYTQSENVVVIGGTSVYSGGEFDTGDATLAADGISFTNMTDPADVTAVNLMPYDTAMLNLAGTLGCTSGALSAQAKADLVDFVADGKKLLIYDSECPTIDYSWLPYPFTTSNPGQLGAQGTLTIDEDNTLSSPDPLSPYYVDTVHLGTQTDAVGDMNVMLTLDPNWKRDMSGTNAVAANGPVHTYAEYPAAGTVRGLIIYNGLDLDFLYPASWGGDAELFKVWRFELLQPFNPSGLPGGVPVVTDVPPVLTLPADITTGPTDASGAVVSYTATATDEEDGDLTPTCVPASGTHFGFGATPVDCSVTDSFGNTTAGSFTVTVTGFDTGDGFFPPIVNGGTTHRKAGSTLPVKFALFGEGGVPITDTAAVVSITYEMPLADAAPAGGTALRYDAVAQQFVFNWKTPKAPGTYTLTVNLSDGTAITALVDLT
jgi:hypothetical protein